MALLNWMARQMSQSHTVLGDSDKTLYTPGEMNGLRTLSETQRNDWSSFRPMPHPWPRVSPQTRGFLLLGCLKF